MTTFTVITEEGARDVDATVGDGGARVEPAAVRDALGWSIEPHGLCRGDVCVPAPDATAVDPAGRVDLVSVAAALGRPVVLDAEAAVVAVGVRAEDRRAALVGLEMPAFTLDDLDGEAQASSQWDGRKRLVVAFASW